MPNSRELAQSTDFLGTLENAIRTDEEAKSREAFKVTVRSQTDADRALSRLTEQGLELGGILALLLSKGRLSLDAGIKTRRGWNLLTLLGRKEAEKGDSRALYVTPQGVLLARRKSRKTPAAAVALVGAVALLGLLASGVGLVAFGACIATLILGTATGVSLYAEQQLVAEYADCWVMLAVLALAVALGTGTYHAYGLIHTAHLLRPLVSGAAMLVACVATAVKAPARLSKFFGWRTAEAGTDFNAETIAALTSLVQPEIEKLGHTLPEYLQPAIPVKSARAIAQG